MLRRTFLRRIGQAALGVAAAVYAPSIALPQDNVPDDVAKVCAAFRDKASKNWAESLERWLWGEYDANVPVKPFGLGYCMTD